MKKLLYLLTIILMTSCHTASYHFNKFIEKGGKVDTKIDSVQVLTTINGKDSLIFVKVNCPEITVPKTNTEIRQDAKTERREIKANEKIESQRLKNENTKLKEENKTLRALGKYKSKENIKINNSNNKTKRVEKRQEGRTTRKKYNIWWVLFYILGLITIPFFKRIKRLFL